MSNQEQQASEERTAWVAGATGLVGRQLLIELVHSPIYSHIDGLVRRRFTPRVAKIECRLVDFDRLDVTTLGHVDDAYCTLGSTLKKAGSQRAFMQVDFDYTLAFARMALAHGARRFFLVSAMGADTGSRLFYSRVKGEAEAAVARVGFESVHIFRPSFLEGVREESRLGERMTLPLLRALRNMLPPKYRAIPASALARAMVAAAADTRPGVHIHESDVLQAFNRR